MSPVTSNSYKYDTIAMEGLTREEMENDQPENKKNVITKVQKFIQDGCGCSCRLSGIQCSSQFVQETILKNLYNCLELTHTELDSVVLANIQAFMVIEGTREKRKRNPSFAFLYQSCQLQCTTHLILHSRYIFQVIRCSWDQFTSRHRINVQFLV